MPRLGVPQHGAVRSANAQGATQDGILYFVGSRMVRSVGRLATTVMLSFDPGSPRPSHTARPLVCTLGRARVPWLAMQVFADPSVPCPTLRVWSKVRVFPPQWETPRIEREALARLLHLGT